MTADERRAAFDALRAHPDLARLLALDPEAGGPARGCQGLALLALGELVALALAFLCALFLPQLALVPLALAVLLPLAGAAQLRRRSRAALERWPARVVRVGVRLTDEGAGARSRYAVVVEDEAGRARELAGTTEAVGALAAGALGVACARGDELVRFVTLAAGGAPQR